MANFNVWFGTNATDILIRITWGDNAEISILVLFSNLGQVRRNLDLFCRGESELTLTQKQHTTRVSYFYVMSPIATRLKIGHSIFKLWRSSGRSLNGWVAERAVVASIWLKVRASMQSQQWPPRRFQRGHDAIMMSLWRQNDVATSFWRHNDVIIASCIRWDITYRPISQILQCTVLSISYNVPFRIEIWTFLFWLVHYGICELDLL